MSGRAPAASFAGASTIVGPRFAPVFDALPAAASARPGAFSHRITHIGRDIESESGSALARFGA